MENKIQELTDKIYREGVEKGNEEARKIIAEAQEKANKIIEDAHKVTLLWLLLVSLPESWQKILNQS